MLVVGSISRLSMKEENMRLLEAAQAAPNCVVSVMGNHAGEGADEIFNRKKNRGMKNDWARLFGL